MVNVIVAFPQLENGKKIKSILAKHGIQACAVCTTGAQTLQHTDALGDGLVICAGRLLDMRYTQLLEYMPETFEMLAMLPPESCMEKEADRVVCLSMPLKVHELVSTVEIKSSSTEIPLPFQYPIGRTLQVFSMAAGSVVRLPSSS